MKKEYEAPKAEKMEFDYEENVVASGGATDQVRNQWSGEHGNGNGKEACHKCK